MQIKSKNRPKVVDVQLAVRGGGARQWWVPGCLGWDWEATGGTPAALWGHPLLIIGEIQDGQSQIIKMSFSSTFNTSSGLIPLWTHLLCLTCMMFTFLCLGWQLLSWLNLSDRILWYPDPDFSVILVFPDLLSWKTLEKIWGTHSCTGKAKSSSFPWGSLGCRGY